MRITVHPNAAPGNSGAGRSPAGMAGGGGYAAAAGGGVSHKNPAKNKKPFFRKSAKNK